MPDLLNTFIEVQALEYARDNRLADVGDVVETTWAGWKKPRKVRITKIGAHLIADWAEGRGFFIDFDMTYVAHRIRKDGSSTEREQTGGICLNNLRTDDGRVWQDRSLTSRNAKWFNHTALSWKLDIPTPLQGAKDS